MRFVISDQFIWQPLAEYSVEGILAFERRYCELQSNTPYDFTGYEFDLHDFGDGGLSCLSSRPLEYLSKINDGIKDRFLSCGCSDEEILAIRAFLNNTSQMFRIDSYHKIPPFVTALCNILDSGLRKLPSFNEDYVTRTCVLEDKIEFCPGEHFKPGFALTTTADHSWTCGSANRYHITPLKPDLTKAKSIYRIYNKASEYQVTFTSDASFIVENIKEWKEKYKEVYLREIID